MTPQELKHWRATLGLSQMQLAIALSVHLVTVARWETGRQRIPPLLSLALAELARRRDA